MIMIHDDVLKILLERKAKAIDLFTDMADILNLLNLRNIMGYPRAARSVFTHPFRAKRELHCTFLGEKGNHYYIQTQYNNLFFP